MLPERVIVFRDGVGDGQLETVHHHEVRQLTECFQAMGADYRYVYGGFMFEFVHMKKDNYVSNVSG